MRQRPQQTLRQLVEQFPAFEQRWAEEQAAPDDGLVDGVYYRWTHHSVMCAFAEFFGANRNGFTQHQLARFGNWINEAVSVDDELENAVSTCLLEHLHQMDAKEVLWPYLSQRARRECRA